MDDVVSVARVARCTIYREVMTGAECTSLISKQQ